MFAVAPLLGTLSPPLPYKGFAMNTDSHFEIGNTHHICQDYAFSGSYGKEGQYSYAIVSDGCSASGKYQPVDFGARLIAHSYAHQLRINNGEMFRIDDSLSRLDDLDKIIQIKYMLNIMAKMSLGNCGYEVYGLDQCVLDCTLLTLVSDGVKLFYSIFGDGTVVIRTEKRLHVIDIEFESGAPFYLSYLLDRDRMSRYVQEFGDQKSFNRTTYNLEEDGCIQDNFFGTVGAGETEGQLFIPCPYGDGKMVFAAVLSDGYKTYFNESLREMVGEDKALENLTLFKNFNGEFVKRRMISDRKKCRRESIVHQDDVSVAAIHFGEE